SEYNGATHRAHHQPISPPPTRRAARLGAGGAHVADADPAGRQAALRPAREGAAAGRDRRGVRALAPVHRGRDAADGGAGRGAARVNATGRRQRDDRAAGRGVSVARVVAPVLAGATGVALLSFLWNDQLLPRTNHEL